MYEHRRQKPISATEFRARVLKHLGWIGLILPGALLLGVLGYRFVAGLPWIDALLNASMILGGMGPVDRLDSDPAKLFASFYALFSGLVFVGVAGILIAPFAHRLLHKLHWEDQEQAD